MFALSCVTAFALWLPAQSITSIRVINRGIPGQTTAEIDKRTETELNTYQPDVVVLFAGMNDAVNDSKFLPPETSRAHLESIVRKSLREHVRVMLVSLHQPDIIRLMQRHKPEAYGKRSPEQRIDDLNAEIRFVAAENNVPVIDFARLLKEHGGPTPEWSTDGVHLTAKGYALLAESVFEQLQRMGHVRDVLCLGDSLTFGIGVRKPESLETPETYPRRLSALVATLAQERTEDGTKSPAR